MTCRSRVALLEVAPGAGDRPAGADAGHEVGDAPAGLPPQLGAGRQVVRLRVGVVEVLVGLEGAGDLLRQPVGHAVVGLRRLRRDGGRRDDDLGAVGAQQVDLLLGHLVRHDRDDAVALQARGDGQARAGVARRRLDDRAAGLELPVALGGLDERHGDAVLDRSARVERLDLGDDLRGQAGAKARQPDERRVADGVEDRVPDVDGGATLVMAHASQCATCAAA